MQQAENHNIFEKAKGQAYLSFLKSTPGQFANISTPTLLLEKIPIIMHIKSCCQNKSTIVMLLINIELKVDKICVKSEPEELTL